MTDWEINERKRRESLVSLAQAIAAELQDGWSVNSNADEHGCGVLNKGPYSIHLQMDQKRLNVSCWNWPSYTKTERGESRKWIIFPNQLYPKQDYPSISVALDRGPAAIAKDIKRRFLPEFERVHALCTEKAAQYQANEDKAQCDWKAICTTAGQPANDRNMLYVSTATLKTIRVENRNGSAHLDLDLNPAQFAAVIAALGGVGEKD